jgi:hypothetical protein
MSFRLQYHLAFLAFVIASVCARCGTGFNSQASVKQTRPSTSRRNASPNARFASQQLDGIHFKAIHFLTDTQVDCGATSAAMGSQKLLHYLPAVLANFTPDGPMAATLRALPRGASHVCADRTGTLYIVAWHKVLQIDRAGNTTQLLVWGDVPRPACPCGIAFDTLRQRVILASIDGIGYLYTYDPVKRSWSCMSDLNNIDLTGLVYSPAEDCLYGLERDLCDRAPAKVHRFDARTGDLLGTVSLSEPICLPHDPTRAAQLAMLGKNLAVLVPPGGPSGLIEADLPAQCVIADPHTGKVLSVSDMELRLPPATDLVEASARVR